METDKEYEKDLLLVVAQHQRLEQFFRSIPDVQGNGLSEQVKSLQGRLPTAIANNVLDINRQRNAVTHSSRARVRSRENFLRLCEDTWNDLQLVKPLLMPGITTPQPAIVTAEQIEMLIENALQKVLAANKIIPQVNSTAPSSDIAPSRRLLQEKSKGDFDQAFSFTFWERLSPHGHTDVSMIEAYSLSELCDQLGLLDERQIDVDNVYMDMGECQVNINYFAEYVADWVEDVLEEVELADELRRFPTPIGMAVTIEWFLKA